VADDPAAKIRELRGAAVHGPAVRP